MKNAIKEKINSAILKSLEKGVVPWRKTWKLKKPCNFKTQKNYKGVNFFLLTMASYIYDFKSPYWVTFNQAKNLGGHVRKGEKCRTFVIYWSPCEKEIEDSDTGEIKTRKYFIQKTYNVFNLDQTAGIEVVEKEETQLNPIEDAEKIINDYKEMPVVNRGEPSYYPAEDYIRMPDMEEFESPQHYYTTLFHEVGHSTGHETRLNRFNGENSVFFDDHSHSQEEIVAELCACYLSAESGVYVEAVEELSKSYIDSWAKKFKEDDDFFFNCITLASKAADYILK